MVTKKIEAESEGSVTDVTLEDATVYGKAWFKKLQDVLI